MSTPDNMKADAEIQALLLDLDAEFGKKPKQRAEAGHKALNTAFHAKHPRLDLTLSKYQLEQMRFDNYYDWSVHKQHLRDIERAQETEVKLQWLPEAMITYIINQTCSCCNETTQFVGSEYVRFRGRRRWYKTLQGELRESYPTMLKRIGEVDGNLLAFGLPGGEPLPDLMEEINETVRRCAGCIMLEAKALDFWVAVTQPSPQSELNIDIPEEKE